MTIESLLLIILNRLNGERFFYAAYHLLKGKKSGQTMQDVNNYKLQPYFMLFPSLHKKTYDEIMKKLHSQQYIEIQADGIILITEEGREIVKALPDHHFNGWEYRGKEHVFFKRLVLVVQTLSQFKERETSFLPNERDTTVQSFVRQFLAHYPPTNYETNLLLHKELTTFFERSKLTANQRTVMLHRLSGYNMSGWTWKQLAHSLQLEQAEVQLLYLEALHKLLDAIVGSPNEGMLFRLARNIKTSTYLTDSASRTKSLVKKGLTLDEIAVVRKLKKSTIEDHFIEIIVNDEALAIEDYVSIDQVKAVQEKIVQLNTKRLKIIKEQFQELSYFQLRIIISLPM